MRITAAHKLKLAVDEKKTTSKVYNNQNMKIMINLRISVTLVSHDDGSPGQVLTQNNNNFLFLTVLK